ncbi:hypothetical protein NQ317_005813 [Molorchus minor]|uniref:TRAF-type domain-containing protein n=1 Tax=Molorchus minor TaxID=1323400 RepID=A0ABQ9IRZ6_9CUCU|nr:hypothetical protein NQ317_005813 [Molorchus minor]
MVRSLAQWTKTLSFPARISPNKSSKESVNIHQVSPTITPTLSNNSLSKHNEINNMMNNNHSSMNEVNQIYSDPESEKAIMSSVVYCIHHKDGCKWSDELRKLKVREIMTSATDALESGHLNTCKHDAIPCTSKCGAQIPRVLMEDHLKYTCPQRRTRCEFCNKEFTGMSLEVLQQGIRGRHPSGSGVQMCPDKLNGPNRCDLNVLAREELETHLKEECTVSSIAAPKEAGCRFKGPRYAMEKHLEENCQQHLTLMSTVVETATPDQFPEERLVQVVPELFRHVDLEDKRFCGQDGRS